MSFTRGKSGFSLIEVLVAVAVASVIITGMVKLFSDFLSIREYFYDKKDRMEILSKIVLVMQADIRAKTGKFILKKDLYGNSCLSFDTTHSLLFNNAVPVTVTYFLKKQQGNKGVLYRREQERYTGMMLEIPLTDLVQGLNFKFFYQDRWQDIPSDVVKVSLKIWNKTYTFSQRSLILEK